MALYTNKRPSGKLMMNERPNEYKSIGIIPVISPGRVWRKNRENLRRTIHVGKTRIMKW
jgi:hypothetical protein